MHKEIVAIVFADKIVKNLNIFTNNAPIAMLPFGGKYKIIDFVLSNCAQSGIDTVGIISCPPSSWKLIYYIGTGNAWDMDRINADITPLTFIYTNMLQALFQSIEYIDLFSPKYVMILSGNDIYKMNYLKMLHVHKDSSADATVSVMHVPWNAVSRYITVQMKKGGYINTFDTNITIPDQNIASMGVYIFSWDVLKNFLLEYPINNYADTGIEEGILMPMLSKKMKIAAFEYSGYWKNITTIQAFWKVNMDLLCGKPELDLYSTDWKIFTQNNNFPAHYIAPHAAVKQSIIGGGCRILGEIKHSILFENVTVEKNAVVENAIILPNCKIGENSIVKKCIVCENISLRQITWNPLQFIAVNEQQQFFVQ